MSQHSIDRLPAITEDLIEHCARQARRERALAFASTLKVIRGVFWPRLVARQATEPEAAEVGRPAQ